MSEKTVGEEAVARLLKPDTKQGIVDTQREMQKDYLVEINKCIEEHSEWTDPFYIVVLQKKERTLENVIRTYYMGRKTLPTPQWDQAVYRYSPAVGDLRFLWVLPDENTAKWLVSCPNDVPADHEALIGFVHSMLDKQLFAQFYEMFHKGETECITSLLLS